MNAYIEGKKARAREFLAEIELPSDGRAKRATMAREWLLENGAAARRDHFWSYTDPDQLTGDVGSIAIDLPEFSAQKLHPSQAIEGEGFRLTPLADANFADAGMIVAAAHEKGARPFAELILAKGEGAVLEVSGDAGRLHIDHKDWNDCALIINMTKGAKLTLIETITQSDQSRLLIEAHLADEAELDHLRIAPALEDRVHAQLFADLGASADLRSFSLVAPSKFRRFESVANLNGRDGHVSISGANWLNAPCFHDDTVYITHNAEDCTSRQVFKRVVAKDAASIFQGKIYVKEGAQKTDGYQISQGLMLEDGGEALTKPELEIYADDVACSHGSTTSGLDETALFYLRSRGIADEMAEKLLVRAFIEEAFEEIRDEALADALRGLAESWIFGSLQ